MKKLKLLLSDSTKNKRHRRNILNILIQILAWLVEFVGCFTIFFGSFIMGHKNSLVTQLLQTLTLLFYFVILPLTFLINGYNFKNTIAESRWYQTLVNTCCPWVIRSLHRSTQNDDDWEKNLILDELFTKKYILVNNLISCL